MVFSIGDIITLVVVLLILVIYRALDRNNRSLENDGAGLIFWQTQ